MPMARLGQVTPERIRVDLSAREESQQNAAEGCQKVDPGGRLKSEEVASDYSDPDLHQGH